MITNIQVFAWDHPELYPPSRLRQSLGVPDQIKVIHGAGDQGPPDYGVAFIYWNPGVILDFRGTLREYDDNEYSYCVSMEDSLERTMIAAFFSDKGRDSYDVTYYDDETWIDWAELLGITTEELLAGLSDPQKCVPYQ